MKCAFPSVSETAEAGMVYASATLMNCCCLSAFDSCRYALLPVQLHKDAMRSCTSDDPKAAEFSL